MNDEKPNKKGEIRFEEGMRQFMGWSKEGGFKYFQELAVDIYSDEKDVGYITKEGKITISGTVTERDPARIMSYSNTFTGEQWEAIGARAREFREKCEHPDFIDPAKQENKIVEPIAQDDISDAEKAQIAPLDRLDMAPTAAEGKVLNMLLRGPGAMNDPAYEVACQELDKERRG